MISSQQSKHSQFAIGILSVLLLLFCFSLLGTAPFLKLLGLSQLNAGLFFTLRLLYWLTLGLLWLYALKIEKQSLLIWKEQEYKFLTYLLSVVVIIVALLILMMLIRIFLSLAHINMKSSRLLEITAILRERKILLVFTALTAGVVEELIFRGYIQPRLQLIFKSPLLAIAISSIIFGLLHYGYGTLFNMIGPFVIGLIFAIYYWQFRNIKILIMCHFLWDLLALSISVKTMH